MAYPTCYSRWQMKRILANLNSSFKFGLMTAALNSCVSSGARHLSGVNITPLRRKASLPDDTHSKIRPANSCRFVKFVSKRPFSVLFNIAPQGRSTSVHERSGSVHERSTFSQGPPLPTPGFIERWTIGDWKLVHSLAWPAKPWRRRIISAWTFDIAARPRWFISSYQLAYISCTAKRKKSAFCTHQFASPFSASVRSSSFANFSANVSS